MFFDNSSSPNVNQRTTPNFSSEDHDGGQLTCPACGGDYLHHDKVEIFDRSEDAPNGLRVVANHGRVEVDTKLDGNPSARRDGVRIHFWCEGCNAKPFMEIKQHKGNTWIGMGYEPGEPESESNDRSDA